MRYLLLLAVVIAASAWSDIARQYPPGKELAVGGQDLARPVAAGKELATTANQDKAVIGKDLAR